MEGFTYLTTYLLTVLCYDMGRDVDWSNRH
uniref:Uncharacterized protein n=1 Tax=Rhizophora mucronata TaxID=61149 RepID=A0A2P2NX03_RHIMU